MHLPFTVPQAVHLPGQARAPRLPASRPGSPTSPGESRTVPASRPRRTRCGPWSRSAGPRTFRSAARPAPARANPSRPSRSPDRRRHAGVLVHPRDAHGHHQPSKPAKTPPKRSTASSKPPTIAAPSPSPATSDRPAATRLCPRRWPPPTTTDRLLHHAHRVLTDGRSHSLAPLPARE